MHRSPVLHVLAVLVLVGAGLSIDSRAGAQPHRLPAVRTTRDLPAITGRLLCDEHSLAPGAGEVHAQLYALLQTPQEVVRDYLTRLQITPPRGDGRHLVVRGRALLVHTIYPSSEPSLGIHCAESARQSEPTLLLATVMHRMHPPARGIPVID